ncbi:hypothetical protein F2Q68_00030688, partial [Brassica cretica]
MQSLCALNLFSKKTIQSFGYIREEEITLMMDKAGKSEFFLFNGKPKRTPHHPYKRCTYPLGEFVPSLAWIDWIQGLDKKVEKVNKEIDVFLEKVVQEHEDADQDMSAFVDILLSTQKDKTTPFELDRAGLKILLVELLFAGSATTFTLMEWTMTELLRHPECMKKLRDEILSVSKHNLYVSEKEVEKMNYLNMVIKEVLINLYAIQRETATWGPDAEKFRPERHFDSPLDFEGQNFKYIPFGSGRRRCPGDGLALPLVELTLANLVKRFNLRFKGGPKGVNKPDLLEATGLDVCRKFPLIVSPFSATIS